MTANCLNILENAAASDIYINKDQLRNEQNEFFYLLKLQHQMYCIIEIDAENMIRKINGVDQMALLQTVLGI